MQAAKQTFSSFDDMIEKCDVPVLVDFYATWYSSLLFLNAVQILGSVCLILTARKMLWYIDSRTWLL